MPLFVSKLADAGAAAVDLFSITRCDGGLGQQVFNSQIDRVIYAKTASGTGQDRIEALVNGATSVAVSAAPAGTTIPDGMGNNVPINLVGGVTYAPDANNFIQVAYCFNNQMYGFDTAGNRITLPRAVILFHELSHAFHRANGSFDAANPEFQAITDENSFRAQVGIALRDPTNHDGGEGPGNGQTVPSCAGMGPTGPSSCCSC